MSGYFDTIFLFFWWFETASRVESHAGDFQGFVWLFERETKNMGRGDDNVIRDLSACALGCVVSERVTDLCMPLDVDLADHAEGRLWKIGDALPFVEFCKDCLVIGVVVVEVNIFGDGIWLSGRWFSGIAI